VSALPPSHSNRQPPYQPPLAGVHERVLDVILESMGAGITVVGREGNFILCNAAAAYIFGITREHTARSYGTAPRAFVYPTASRPIRVTSCPVSGAGRRTVEEAELFVRHALAPKGIWVNVRARPFACEAGNLIGPSLFTANSSRARTGNRRCGPRRGAAASCSRKTSPVSCAVPLDGRVLDCNEAFAPMLGCGCRAELEALNALAFYYQPSDRAHILARLQDQK